MKQSLNTLKTWFRRGIKPTQSQFSDLFDSFFHKDENVPAASVKGLQELLDEKASAILLASIDERVNVLENAPEDIATKFVNASLIYDDAGNLVTDDDGFIILNDYILPSQLV